MEDTFRQCGREPGLILFETILWDGHCAPRWPLHLARLKRSFDLLGWGEPQVPTLPRPQAPARLRLSMAQTPSGGGGGEASAPPAPPAPPQEKGGAPFWAVGLTGRRLHSQSPWLGIKSNRRANHDAARAEMPSGLDEVLFLNERDELCEGSITNIFFDRGQGMRTPPLSCGLLPGVLRAELGVPEEILRVEELGAVRLWVGNALRGLIEARFIA